MRLINLLFKQLILVLFVLVFVAIATVVGFFVSEPVVRAVARVFLEMKPTENYSIPIQVLFFAFVLSGLLIGVAAAATLARDGPDPSKRTDKGSLLRLLAAGLCVTSGT